MKLKVSSDDFTRRDFLKVSVVWTSGLCIMGVPVISRESYRVFTAEEAEIMDTLADCIIPPDEWAGGKDAGVTFFIDQQLSEEGYLQKDMEMYKTCLPALNKGCIDEFGIEFTALPHKAQVEYLKKMEAGKYDHQQTRNWGTFTPSSFFNIMRDQCMMGFYGGPKHGGNKSYISYHMLKF